MMEPVQYWIHVSYKEDFQFSVHADGTIKFGENYSPEKCKLAFEEYYPSLRVIVDNAVGTE